MGRPIDADRFKARIAVSLQLRLQDCVTAEAAAFMQSLTQGLMMDIDNEPTMDDVAPVTHGYWVENETSYADYPTGQTCTCSFCGTRSLRPLGSFCRYCGTSMDMEPPS